MLLFAALWLLAELARGQWFTGFPWVASGYAQVDSPLSGLAPWVGVYGMGAVLAWAAARPRWRALARAQRPWHRGRAWPVAMAAALAAVVAAAAGPAGMAFTRATGEMSVALLQTHVSQDEKFAAEHMPQTLAWVGRELLAARADLVVTPETAVPLLPDQLEPFAPGYWAASGHFAVPGRAALVGLPLGDFDRGYTNSVSGLSSASAAGVAAEVPLRQVAPGALRRVHPHRLSLVHRADEHPAGRLCARPVPTRRRLPSGRSAWRPTSATKTCSAKNWRGASWTPPWRPR